MLTSDFDYDLPENLIASQPLEDRAASRMLVVDRKSGTWTHGHFCAFPSYVQAGDLCVLNDSRVVPARFLTDDGSELLKLAEPEPGSWIALVKPGRRLRPGRGLTVGGCRGTVVSILEDGARLIRWDSPPNADTHGQLALPPYMNRSADVSDLERYQTIFARQEGSIAAPTAGLHFTPEILNSLNHAFITLHVGVGTFRPVKSDRIEDHRMHAEHFEISSEAASRIRSASRVIAIGTTTTRVLEHLGRQAGGVSPGQGTTSIFIHPPASFHVVGALLTNFHLPRSTLLMLVCAFAGRELILDAYRDAVRQKYRFFSYGDCMLIA